MTDYDDYCRRQGIGDYIGDGERGDNYQCNQYDDNDDDWESKRSRNINKGGKPSSIINKDGKSGGQMGARGTTRYSAPRMSAEARAVHERAAAPARGVIDSAASFKDLTAALNAARQVLHENDTTFLDGQSRVERLKHQKAESKRRPFRDKITSACTIAGLTTTLNTARSYLPKNDNAISRGQSRLERLTNQKEEARRRPYRDAIDSASTISDLSAALNSARSKLDKKDEVLHDGQSRLDQLQQQEANSHYRPLRDAIDVASKIPDLSAALLNTSNLPKNDPAIISGKSRLARLRHQEKEAECKPYREAITAAATSLALSAALTAANPILPANDAAITNGKTRLALLRHQEEEARRQPFRDAIAAATTIPALAAALQAAALPDDDNAITGGKSLLKTLHATAINSARTVGALTAALSAARPTLPLTNTAMIKGQLRLDRSREKHCRDVIASATTIPALTAALDAAHLILTETEAAVTTGQTRLIHLKLLEHQTELLASALSTHLSDSESSNESLSAALELGVAETDERVVEIRAALHDAPYTRLSGLLTDPSSTFDPGIVPFDYFANCTLQWDSERKVGYGLFGDVFLAVDHTRSLRYVVKKINLASLASISETPAELGERMRTNEITALTLFRSPFIVKLAGFTHPGERQICLAYEYCAGGALDKALLDDSKAGELTWKHRIRVALGIAKALNYLHRGGGGDRCFHRDVKAANICLTASLSPKLIDCGLARFIPDGDDRVAVTATNNGQPGTLGYKCPRYEGGDKFTAKSEVFSFGVVLLELLVGDVTVVGKRSANLYFHFCEDEEEELEESFDTRAEGDGEWPESVKIALVALTKACLEAKPKKRIELQPVMRQLQELERAHCDTSKSDEMIIEMREERERALEAAQVEEAGERATAKECMICYNDECRGSDGICCVGGHYFCSSCYDRTIGDELDRISSTRVLLDDHRAREGKMRCPQSGDGCSELFSDYQLAQVLSDERFSEYARVRDETHAARVREIAEIEVRRQIQREREMEDVERRRDEEGKSDDLIEQEIAAGRMKRCRQCRIPIAREGGCDTMHCRGAGGCGASFCFVCGAASQQATCPGAGHPHVFYNN